MFTLINRDCPVCNSSNKQSKLIGMLTPNNLPFKNEPLKFPLSQCSVCDMVYLSEIPRKEDLFKCYTENIQFTCDNYTGDRVPLILEYFALWMNKIIQYAKLDKENIKSLEIGGGLSWVSRVMKSFSERNFTVSQDLTSECVNTCTWVDKYYLGDLPDVMDSLRKHAPYQIISMSHVFEHLIDPIDVLRKCGELLDDKGIIFINAPHRPANWNDSSSFESWEKWSYNHVPTHINYYNSNSLTKAAERSGLEMVFFEAKAEEGQAFEVWFAKKKKQ